MTKILLMLLCVVGFAAAADDDVANTQADDNLSVVDSGNSTLVLDTEQQEINPDDKLKNDIITFDRVNYIKDWASISDPFIYVYPKSEEDLANIIQTEQAVLVLNGIFENKAKINNTWVAKDDVIEGWKVSDIKLDKVELTFRTKTKVLYVYSQNENFEIK